MSKKWCIFIVGVKGVWKEANCYFRPVLSSSSCGSHAIIPHELLVNHGLPTISQLSLSIHILSLQINAGSHAHNLSHRLLYSGKQRRIPIAAIIFLKTTVPSSGIFLFASPKLHTADTETTNFYIFMHHCILVSCPSQTFRKNAVATVAHGGNLLCDEMWRRWTISPWYIIYRCTNILPPAATHSNDSPHS